MSPLLVLIVGFLAAFGAGKLPPVLPAIQVELGISLLEASLLVGMFQLAGALIGVFAGALADRAGHRNLMMAGLCLLILGSIVGALAATATGLLLSRALESLGFILSVLPGPALMRQLVPEHRLSRWLGAWGTYMPIGFAMGLVVSPWLAGLWHWQAVWWCHAGLTVLGLVMVARYLPVATSGSHAKQTRFSDLLLATVTSVGPWLLAVSFAAYAGQYLSIIAFLPTIYQQAGVAADVAGLMTALAAVINVLGNISAGQLIHRGVRPPVIIGFAAITLIVGSWLIFAGPISFMTRYYLVLVVSAVMGLVPGSLFVLASRYAPNAQAVSTTVGLLQQGSALGQLVLPVIVAWTATVSSGWQNTWIATGAFAVVNLLLACVMLRRDVAPARSTVNSTSQ